MAVSGCLFVSCSAVARFVSKILCCKCFSFTFVDIFSQNFSYRVHFAAGTDRLDFGGGPCSWGFCCRLILPSVVRTTVAEQFVLTLQWRLVLAEATCWLRGPAVEHRSLAGVLSLSCARPVADG